MLLQLMGGKVWLESEGLGKGSSCKMYISLGIPDDVKRVRNSPRVDSAALLDLKNLKVSFFPVLHIPLYVLQFCLLLILLITSQKTLSTYMARATIF